MYPACSLEYAHICICKSFIKWLFFFFDLGVGFIIVVWIWPCYRRVGFSQIVQQCILLNNWSLLGMAAVLSIYIHMHIRTIFRVLQLFK